MFIPYLFFCLICFGDGVEVVCGEAEAGEAKKAMRDSSVYEENWVYMILYIIFLLVIKIYKQNYKQGVH